MAAGVRAIAIYGKTRQMRFDYINAFVQATAEVLNEMFGDKVERSRPALHGGITPKGGVVAALSLTGDVLGDVVFDMDEDTALNIAGRMNEKEFVKPEPMVFDSIGELDEYHRGPEHYDT